MKLQIDGKELGRGAMPYVVAEISANHNGSLDRAKRCIEAAKKAGADAVKIQTYTADTMTLDIDNPEFLISGGLWDGYRLYDLYKWAQTPYEWHEPLFNCAKDNGITIFSSPFDSTAVELLSSLQAPAYKIASFELTDIPLIRSVAQKKKPIIMSTGMATDKEIQDAIFAAKEAGGEDLVLLHCISGYPTKNSDAQVFRVSELINKFQLPVGLSDHTLSVDAAICATALGGCIIEKHFTLSRSDGGPDSQFSIEPNELEELCKTVYRVWEVLGSPPLVRPENELQSKKFRRSIYFTSDMKKGQTVTVGDIRCIRPANGLAPKFFDSLVGQRLAQDVDAGQPSNWNMFESQGE
jgi:pseudaminic acid synthase